MLIGLVLYMPMLFNKPSILSDSVFVLAQHDVLAEIAKEVSSPWQAMLHAPTSLVFWLTVLGIFIAWLCYIAVPKLPEILATRLSWIYRILMNKYGFDWFNEHFFMNGTKSIGSVFYKVADRRLIDGLIVNGSGKTIGWLAKKTRTVQSGYLYQYVAVMVLGIFGFLFWFLY